MHSDLQKSIARGARPIVLTNRRRLFLQQAAITIALVVVLLVMVFPIFWMGISSLKGPGELFLRTPTFWPQDPQWSNYANVFERFPFVRYFINSVIVAVSTTALSVVIGLVSGYSFARFAYPGRRPALYVILVSQMFPGFLLVIPMYLILRSLGLTNSHPGLIIAYTTFVLPFCVWMMKGFYQTIPRDLEEAGLLDGCTRVQVLFRIALPLALPGAAATGLFAFVVAWNEFLFALNLTSSDHARTLPVGISLLVGRYFNDWGALMAAAVMMTVPTVIIFVLLQKYLISGLTAGAVKE